MKKAIAALLSLFVGIFGYSITEKTIDERVSDLENENASMKSIISVQQDEIDAIKGNTKLDISEMKVGDKIKCSNTPEEFDWTDGSGQKIHFNSCELILREINDSLSNTYTSYEYDSDDWSTCRKKVKTNIFEFVATGVVDSKFAGYRINVSLALDSIGWIIVLEGTVNDDGSFTATFNSDSHWNLYDICAVNFCSAELVKYNTYTKESSSSATEISITAGQEEL